MIPVIKPQIFKTILTSKKCVAENVYEYNFLVTDPDEFEFLPGQYISVVIDEKTKRSYSISSSPSESKKNIKTIIDLSPGGPGSKYFENVLIDSEITIIGPLGFFILPEILRKNIYFLATGSGISPLKSMIDTLKYKGEYKEMNIQLIFGCRYGRNIILENYFEELKKSGVLSVYAKCLSREELPGCERGYITAYLEKQELDPQDAQFFVCGGGEVVKSVVKLLKEKKIPEDAIFYERFY